ncbi:ADP,ATP carrier protein, partial [Tetrabaena socialis]
MADDGADGSGSARRIARDGSLASDSVAALLSSSLFATTFYPLHRVKILLQTQDSNPLVVSGVVRRYTVLDALPRLLKDGGLRELWRGNAAYMLRHVPSTTLSFAFKDAVLRVAPRYDSPEQLPLAAAVNMGAGFVGGAAALLLVYPLDFATIRMASELRKGKRSLGVMDTLNSTQRSGGLSALYRGYGVSAAAIGAYKALYFGLYDTACAAMEHRAAAAHLASLSPGPGPASESLAPPPPSSSSSSGGTTPGVDPAAALGRSAPSRLGLMERWAAANVVVVTASSLTYPLDVVRKRLVADTALGPGRQQYAGLVDCVAKMGRTE